MNIRNDISFNEALDKLGMGNASSGLRFVSERTKEDDPNLYLALERAYEFEATAVYFKFYDNERPPQPQVYIYDRSGLLPDDLTNAEIHHRLWNAGVVPFCFIFRASEVLVYNCSKKPRYDEGGKFTTGCHDLIKLLGKSRRKIDAYNARNFDSGLFWESSEGKGFRNGNGAYQQLLNQLKNAKSIIISKVGVEHASLVKRLLMMLILIKYLEERKDEEGNGALNPEEFYSMYNPDNPSLEGVLTDSMTFLAVLDELARKELFNGQIFQLSDEDQQVLKSGKIDLRILIHFVKGDMEFFETKQEKITGQMTLWRLYEFNYLPVELISHIYEDFLVDEDGQKKKGVVYTPPYLVQFLVDRCMPLGKPKKEFKVLDPACGSGIFLVGAFKRMIQWWRVRNGWKKPTKDNIEEIKRLLKDNIFGCDIVEEAVTLTYFSLSLALLDSLSPKEIWGNVHFDNLIGSNLVKGDFFKTVFERDIHHDFDLVIGNPPFESKLTLWAQEVETQERSENSERPSLPDKQIALLFLEQSLKLLKQGGNCCLILPSGPVLYNTGAKNFRSFLFQRYYLKGIYDFSPLRAKLFVSSSSSAKPAVISVFLENNSPDNRPSFHYIFRRTKASGEKVDFEIDHYDIHKVSHALVVRSDRVWQANFMGGGRLHHLLERIGTMRSLGEYLEEKVSEDGWKVAEGWIESRGAAGIDRVNRLAIQPNRTETEEKEFELLEEKYRADWITGHQFVETDSFTEKGIGSIRTCDIEYFYRSAKDNKEIFQPPHLLIKEQAGIHSIPIEYNEEYLTFKDSIIGVHAPGRDKHLLERIEKRFKNDQSYSALLWLLSGKIITKREGVVQMSDILSLPYPEEEIEFNAIEEILLSDISEHYSDFRKEGEKSAVLTPVGTNDLEIFGEVFCNILNSIYDDFYAATPIKGKGFVAYPFVLGEEPKIEIPKSIEEVENELANLLESQEDYNLWVKKILKVYHENVIFLYKPNQKRYWLPSIAIRDADATFLDLYKQGK